MEFIVFIIILKTSIHTSDVGPVRNLTFGFIHSNSTLLRVVEGQGSLWICLVYPNLDWGNLERNLWPACTENTPEDVVKSLATYPGIEPVMISSFISKCTFREHSSHCAH